MSPTKRDIHLTPWICPIVWNSLIPTQRDPRDSKRPVSKMALSVKAPDSIDTTRICLLTTSLNSQQTTHWYLSHALSQAISDESLRYRTLSTTSFWKMIMGPLAIPSGTFLECIIRVKGKLTASILWIWWSQIPTTTKVWNPWSTVKGRPKKIRLAGTATAST